MSRWPAVVISALLLAPAGLIAGAAPALAHANMASSEPAGGAALEEAPEQVRITFTEPPDPGLTAIEVAGASGTYQSGEPELIPGDEMSVIVDLEPMDQGSYTVSWRTVSKVDGHTSAGGFAFGIGEAPDPSALTAVDDKAEADLPGSASRWALYLGLAALVGAAWIALFAARELDAVLLKMLRLGWLVAVAGLAGLGLSQWIDSEAALPAFASSSAGRAMAFRAVPLLAAGLGLLLLRSRPRAALYTAGAGASATMLTHVLAGHAAVEPMAWLKVAAQWVHLLGIGLWIGGLAALLLVMRNLDEERRLWAAKRFSLVAGVSIFAVAGTGVLRAVNELGRLGALWDTGYGLLVAGKSALLVMLGVLGAVNRFKTVPKAGEAPEGLRKVGRAELMVAVIALALAGTLANSVPPVSEAAAAKEQGPIEVTGTTFARTARASLTVAPGNPGINRFQVSLTDLESGDLHAGGSVTLELDPLSNPQAQPASIDLEETEPGLFEASSPALSSAGRYRAVVLVQRGAGTFQVPLEFSTKLDDFTVRTSQAQGQPTLYTISNPAGQQLQFYADPEAPGRSEVHLTFFDTSGQELPVEDIVAIAAFEEERGVSLATRRFGPGHFVADLTLEEGAYLFDAVAITDNQDRLRFAVEVTVTQ